SAMSPSSACTPSRTLTRPPLTVRRTSAEVAVRMICSSNDPKVRMLSVRSATKSQAFPTSSEPTGSSRLRAPDSVSAAMSSAALTCAQALFGLEPLGLAQGVEDAVLVGSECVRGTGVGEFAGRSDAVGQIRRGGRAHDDRGPGLSEDRDVVFAQVGGVDGREV